MKKVLVEFPVIGYAEVVIEVEDDLDSEQIIDMIEDGDIDVPYDGHDHAEILIPLMSMSDWRQYSDQLPSEIRVLE